MVHLIAAGDHFGIFSELLCDFRTPQSETHFIREAFGRGVKDAQSDAERRRLLDWCAVCVSLLSKSSACEAGHI